MGYLPFDGMFNLTINYDSGYADLTDISMTPLWAFDWSSLNGTFNSSNLYLSSPSLPGLDDNYLSGTFDGDTAFLQGIVRDNAYDGYIYDCTFNAVVIPEPATLLLLGLGGLALLRKRKK